MADSKERRFQTDILNSLEKDGWLIGSAVNYDKVNAVYTEDLIGFVKDAYPDRWSAFCKSNPGDLKKLLVHAAVKGMTRDGALHLLRHGFKAIGGTIKVCAFRPDHGMNPDTERRYQSESVASLRKCPTHLMPAKATITHASIWCFLSTAFQRLPHAELKSEFKQTVEHAKRQYKFDRRLKIRLPANQSH